MIRNSFSLLCLSTLASGFVRTSLPPNAAEGADMAPADFDCAARRLAVEFAAHLQPFRSKSDFLDMVKELNLPGGAPGGETQCFNITYNGPDQTFKPSYPIPSSSNTAIFFVDAEKGSDSAADGKSPDSAFKSFEKALEAVRSARANGAVSKGAIVLREGVYYLKNTVKLTEADSDLTIQNYKDEKPILSGGRKLNVDWKADPERKGVYMAKVSKQQYQLSDEGPGGVRINRKRAVRARYPNGCTNTTQPLPSHYLCRGSAPKGGVVDPNDGFGSNLVPKSWISPEQPTLNSTTTFAPASPARTSGATFTTYQLGYGGSCAGFDPPSGYWCGNQCSGGAPKPPGCIFRSPVGFEYDHDSLPNSPYKDVKNAVVHVWHPGHWASWMFSLSEKSNSTHMIFGKGGFQGGRGQNKGEAIFVENVKEELDALNEFFYEVDTETLYYFSGESPPTNVEVTSLVTLISIQGGQNSSTAARNIQFKGLGFRDSNVDFMGPHSMPSGGDWGLAHSAAVHAEGVEGFGVYGCTFEKLDGNALMLRGYSRDANIVMNKFEEIGASMIVQHGKTRGAPPGAGEGMGPDGTGGTQPRHTTVAYNWGTRCGLFEKQSSFYFQAKSCENIVKGNIFYHGPRAAVNFNDGFGGGSVLDNNLLFNTVMETGDHGPFNSWDRQPFITKVRDGQTASPEKAYDEIRNNMIVGNYYGQEGIDNDDGSQFYNTHHNFFVYSQTGMKNDFGGHDNVHHSNVYAYVGKGLGINAALSGHADSFYDNKVVLLGANSYASFDCSCKSSDSCPDLHNNEIYSSTGEMGNTCGKTLEQLQKEGLDIGTTVSARPRADEVISWGRTLLGLSPN